MNNSEELEGHRDAGSPVAVADPTRDIVAHVGGAGLGPAVPDCSVSETAAGDDWADRPRADWLDDPDAHLEEVVDYIGRLHASCQSSDEFVAALSSLFPELEEKVARAQALAAEYLGDGDVPDPDADIAAGRSIFYSSGAEFLASLMARPYDPPQA